MTISVIHETRLLPKYHASAVVYLTLDWQSGAAASWMAVDGILITVCCWSCATSSKHLWFSELSKFQNEWGYL